MEMKVIALIVVFSAYVLASPMNLPPGHPPVIFRGMHEWQTPSESDKRSPCPALNTLANHGYLNRNGQQITAKQMQDAMSRVYNLSPAVGWLLANAAVKGLSPKNGMISLDQLQKHGFIEHDASLVHDDTALGSNWIINNDFLNQFSSLSTDGQFLTMDQLAAFRSIREKYSLVKNDYFTFDFKEKLVAYGEAGLLWKTLARRWPGHRNVLMRIRDIRQFLGEERLPADYAPPAKSVGLFDIIGAGRKIYKISRKHK